MATVKKTVSIPEDLYREVTKENRSFSRVVSEALQEYLKKKRKERLESLWGALKDMEIQGGTEFVDELRMEQLRVQEERERWEDT